MSFPGIEFTSRSESRLPERWISRKEKAVEGVELYDGQSELTDQEVKADPSMGSSRLPMYSSDAVSLLFTFRRGSRAQRVPRRSDTFIGRRRRTAGLLGCRCRVIGHSKANGLSTSMVITPLKTW